MKKARHETILTPGFAGYSLRVPACDSERNFERSFMRSSCSRPRTEQSAPRVEPCSNRVDEASDEALDEALDVGQVLEPGAVLDTEPDVVLVPELDAALGMDEGVVLGMEPDEASGVALGEPRYNVACSNPTPCLEGKSVLGVDLEPDEDEVLVPAEFRAEEDKYPRC